MNKNILIAVGVIVLLGVGAWVIFRKASPYGTGIPYPTVVPTIVTGTTDERVIMDPDEADKILKERKQTSQYIPFTQEEYQQAISDGQTIVLNFYADWCPICRAEAPEIEEAFFELKDPNIIGFRVNFKDAETDDDEKALAKQFNVPYQHTKIILKNGKEVARYTDQWDREAAISALRKESQ